MNVSGKYLKDESGDTFSPITSVDTIFKGNIKLLDLIYPVGSYYETSDDSFDPNESWGGVWSLDTDGTVLVSEGLYDENTRVYQVGETFGNQWISLTTQNLPAHKHTINSHTHSFSTTTGGGGYHSFGMNTMASANTVNFFGALSSGLKRTHTDSVNSYYSISGRTEKEGALNLLTVPNHTHTVSDTTGGTSLTTNSTGNGTNINITQPSKVVCRWHRTA